LKSVNDGQIILRGWLLLLLLLPPQHKQKLT
jgi:hypothetical protein